MTESLAATIALCRGRWSNYVMHADANQPPRGDGPWAAESIVEAELVGESRGPRWLITLLVIGGLLIFVTALVLMVLSGGVFVSGPAGRLAGTWVQTDGPPSLSARAMMSIGSEVISNRVYRFSGRGSVVEKIYPRGARGPVFESKGSWKVLPERNGSDGEFTILIDFGDREPRQIVIQFVDRQNAEFRMHDGDTQWYYKVK